MLSNQTSSKDQSSYPSAYAHSLAAMGIDDSNVTFTSPQFKGQSKLIHSQSSSRDCSKVGTAVRAFRTYQKEQGARRRQQGGFGAIAATLIVGGLLSIYFWSLIPGLVILGLGVLGAVCLPMIKKPQMPNNLDILPRFDNPDDKAESADLKAKAKPEKTAKNAASSGVSMPTADLALEAKASPILFSEPQEEGSVSHHSHQQDTFDIVASKKKHSKAKKR